MDCRVSLALTNSASASFSSPLVDQEAGHVRLGLSDLGVLFPVHVNEDRQCFPVMRLGLLPLIHVIQRDREVVVREAGLQVVLSQHLVAGGEDVAQQRFGVLIPAM